MPPKIDAAQESMPPKSSRTAFFAAIGFAALAIVVGAAAIFFQYSDHARSFRVPAIELSISIVLMVCTLLAESPGRSQKLFLACATR